MYGDTVLSTTNGTPAAWRGPRLSASKSSTLFLGLPIDSV